MRDPDFPRRLLSAGVLASGLALLAGCKPSPDTDPKPAVMVTIGTGAETGVYYPAGGAIASIVNRTVAWHGVKAAAITSKGSIDNINSLLAGDIQFGIAQSDSLHNAANGVADWNGNPQEKLRFVFSLHPESVTLVAAVDAGIGSVKDLRGKRVNLGVPGSGTRQNAEAVLKAAGIGLAQLGGTESASPGESPQLLEEGKIDAFFYTVGHPARAIEEATAGSRALRFVPITGVDGLLDRHPYLRRTVVQTDLYPRMQGSDAETVGFLTTVVTTSDVPEDVVHSLVQAVFTNLEEFRSMHPALQTLSRQGMLQGGLAPLHPGAERYYREAALLR